MMKKRILIALLAVVLIAAIACTVFLLQREGSKGILYHVTGENSAAYLLGSIHIGSAAMHPFGNTIQEAMASADTFVFETDTTSDTSLAQLSRRQTLPDDTTLSGILGDALMEQVTAAYQELGLRTANLDTRQPWAVINTLAVYSTAAELDVPNVRKAISLGVEPVVMAYADKHHKQLRYLETVDEVADTMESFSDALNEYLLLDEIAVIFHQKFVSDTTSVSQWPAWWRDGNAEAFRNFYRQSFAAADTDLYAEYENKLVTQRNILMAERLDAMLQNGGTFFVTVGLLHLVEESDSMLTLLQEKGYAIEQIVE